MCACVCCVCGMSCVRSWALHNAAHTSHTIRTTIPCDVPCCHKSQSLPGASPVPLSAAVPPVAFAFAAAFAPASSAVPAAAAAFAFAAAGVGVLLCGGFGVVLCGAFGVCVLS